jgi:hypothetical protein
MHSVLEPVKSMLAGDLKSEHILNERGFLKQPV